MTITGSRQRIILQIEIEDGSEKGARSTCRNTNRSTCWKMVNGEGRNDFRVSKEA